MEGSVRRSSGASELRDDVILWDSCLIKLRCGTSQLTNHATPTGHGNKCAVNSQSRLYSANYPSLTQTQPSALCPRHGPLRIQMEHNDESVPLLTQSEPEASRFQQKPNPLPWPQLSAVLFVKTCDALASQSIKPYINEVRTLWHGRAWTRVDLSLYPACRQAGHHWWRQS